MPRRQAPREVRPVPDDRDVGIRLEGDALGVASPEIQVIEVRERAQPGDRPSELLVHFLSPTRLRAGLPSCSATRCPQLSRVVRGETEDDAVLVQRCVPLAVEDIDRAPEEDLGLRTGNGDEPVKTGHIFGRVVLPNHKVASVPRVPAVRRRLGRPGKRLHHIGEAGIWRPSRPRDHAPRLSVSSRTPRVLRVRDVDIGEREAPRPSEGLFGNLGPALPGTFRLLHWRCAVTSAIRPAEWLECSATAHDTATVPRRSSPSVGSVSVLES